MSSAKYEIERWLDAEMRAIEEQCQRPHKSLAALYRELQQGIDLPSYTTKKEAVPETLWQKGAAIYTIYAPNLSKQNYMEILLSSDRPSNFFNVSLHFLNYTGKLTLHPKSSYRSEDDNAAVVYDLLEAMSRLLKELPEKVAYYEEKERNAKANREKRAKIKSMQASGIDTWLEQICKSLTVPYAIEKGSIDYKLRVKISPKLQIVQYIPLKNFQEVMPTIFETIATYSGLAEKQKAKVLVENVSANAKIRWQENEK
jgi:hypothetical protein